MRPTLTWEMTLFHYQTAAAVMKANCMLARIKNSFAVLNIFTLPQLFMALVRPLLEYANVIWGPQYKLDHDNRHWKRVKDSKERHKMIASIERLRFCAPPEGIETSIT